MRSARAAHYLFCAVYLLCMAGLLNMTATGDAFNVSAFLERPWPTDLGFLRHHLPRGVRRRQPQLRRLRAEYHRVVEGGPGRHQRSRPHLPVLQPHLQARQQDAEAARWLSPGSWILNGAKTFTTHGSVGDVSVVFAVDDLETCAITTSSEKWFDTAATAAGHREQHQPEPLASGVNGASSGMMYELRHHIDRTFPVDLDTFVEARQSIATGFVLQFYADVMNPFATRERHFEPRLVDLDGETDVATFNFAEALLRGGGGRVHPLPSS